jgi:membrane-associated protease RseP (regulator of RpoE activity)
MRKYVVAIVGISVSLLAVAVLVRLSRTSSSAEIGRKPSSPRIETRKLDGNRWIVSRLDRDSYLNDLARATKQITLKPFPGQEPNSVTDIKILKIAEESPMYAAGFRKGDRILKVNGTPITTMSRAVNLVHEVKACDRLTVQVQRGDQIIDYQFDFE